MPVPSIHKVGHRFDDRNTFLHVALGTIATLHRLRDFFRAYGAPASPGPGGPDGTADEGDALYLALGLVSFSRTIVRHLAVTRSAAAERATSGAAARDSDPAPPGVLRLLLR